MGLFNSETNYNLRLSKKNEEKLLKSQKNIAKQQANIAKEEARSIRKQAEHEMELAESESRDRMRMEQEAHEHEMEIKKRDAFIESHVQAGYTRQEAAMMYIQHKKEEEEEEKRIDKKLRKGCVIGFIVFIIIFWLLIECHDARYANATSFITDLWKSSSSLLS